MSENLFVSLPLETSSSFPSLMNSFLNNWFQSLLEKLKLEKLTVWKRCLLNKSRRNNLHGTLRNQHIFLFLQQTCRTPIFCLLSNNYHTFPDTPVHTLHTWNKENLTWVTSRIKVFSKKKKMIVKWSTKH